MGEVYRARDTKLNRDVAAKVLPALLADEAQYMARFECEAQVLASLNHPNIATIHGLAESDGIRALVMELVEGARSSPMRFVVSLFHPCSSSSSSVQRPRFSRGRAHCLASGRRLQTLVRRRGSGYSAGMKLAFELPPAQPTNCAKKPIVSG